MNESGSAAPRRDRRWKPITVSELCEFFDGLDFGSVRVFFEGTELDVMSLDTTRSDEYELVLDRRPSDA